MHASAGLRRCLYMPDSNLLAKRLARISQAISMLVLLAPASATAVAPDSVFACSPIEMAESAPGCGTRVNEASEPVQIKTGPGKGATKLSFSTSSGKAWAFTPPKDFDFASATSEQLAFYGIPAEPLDKSSEVHAKWRYMVNHMEMEAPGSLVETRKRPPRVSLGARSGRASSRGSSQDHPTRTTRPSLTTINLRTTILAKAIQPTHTSGQVLEVSARTRFWPRMVLRSVEVAAGSSKTLAISGGRLSPARTRSFAILADTRSQLHLTG